MNLKYVPIVTALLATVACGVPAEVEKVIADDAPAPPEDEKHMVVEGTHVQVLEAADYMLAPESD